MPLVSWLTIFSLRACIFFTSIFAPVTEIPCAPNLCTTRSKSSEDSSSALEGMQPTLRQVPPSAYSPFSFFHSSMQAVLKPSCAARIAAT